jgi:hypothetical protein
MVKAAKGAASRRHAAAHALAFFKKLDRVAGLLERSGAGDAGNTSTNHSQMLGGG